MKTALLAISLLFFYSNLHAKRWRTVNPEFTKKIESLIGNSKVKQISVQELKSLIGEKTSLLILDAREKAEYNVSHLKDAIWVGYDNFSLQKTLEIINNYKKSKIIVYCSVGYRSNKISEKLQRKNLDVMNLYGGIFEWYNQKLPLYKGKEKVNKVHPYSQSWKKWLIKTY